MVDTSCIDVSCMYDKRQSTFVITVVNLSTFEKFIN
jgi:hypothetical protein